MDIEFSLFYFSSIIKKSRARKNLIWGLFIVFAMASPVLFIIGLLLTLTSMLANYSMRNPKVKACLNHPGILLFPEKSDTLSFLVIEKSKEQAKEKPIVRFTIEVARNPLLLEENFRSKHQVAPLPIFIDQDCLYNTIPLPWAILRVVDLEYHVLYQLFTYEM